MRLTPVSIAGVVTQQKKQKKKTVSYCTQEHLLVIWSSPGQTPLHNYNAGAVGLYFLRWKSYLLFQ